MCKVGLKLLILLISSVAIPTISFSDSIPMKYQGFWSGKSCDFSIEKYALFIGENGYLYEDDTEVEFNFVSPEEKDGWTLLSTNDKNYDFYLGCLVLLDLICLDFAGFLISIFTVFF